MRGRVSKREKENLLCVCVRDTHAKKLNRLYVYGWILPRCFHTHEHTCVWFGLLCYFAGNLRTFQTQLVSLSFLALSLSLCLHALCLSPFLSLSLSLSCLSLSHAWILPRCFRPNKKANIVENITCIYICLYSIYICMYVYIYIHLYTCIHIHIYVHSHTHTHKDTHRHISLYQQHHLPDIPNSRWTGFSGDG
jgi:hypothetical protein